jgi:hypothetical protein
VLQLVTSPVFSAKTYSGIKYILQRLSKPPTATTPPSTAHVMLQLPGVFHEKSLVAVGPCHKNMTPSRAHDTNVSDSPQCRSMTLLWWACVPVKCFLVFGNAALGIFGNFKIGLRPRLELVVIEMLSRAFCDLSLPKSSRAAWSVVSSDSSIVSFQCK